MKIAVLSTILVTALAACSAPDAPQAAAPNAAPASGAAKPLVESASQSRASASGTVESIDAAGGKIVISHGPVSALEWPAMTMGFHATPEQIAAVQPGQPVEFEFTVQGPEATLTNIEPAR
jgi:Cu(I)/Ag(I) efflux system protein CusF